MARGPELVEALFPGSRGNRFSPFQLETCRETGVGFVILFSRLTTIANSRCYERSNRNALRGVRRHGRTRVSVGTGFVIIIESGASWVFRRS